MRMIIPDSDLKTFYLIVLLQMSMNAKIISPPVHKFATTFLVVTTVLAAADINLLPITGLALVSVENNCYT
jgi:hypothetical protein